MDLSELGLEVGGEYHPGKPLYPFPQRCQLQVRALDAVPLPVLNDVEVQALHINTAMTYEGRRWAKLAPRRIQDLHKGIVSVHDDTCAWRFTPGRAIDQREQPETPPPAHLIEIGPKEHCRSEEDTSDMVATRQRHHRGLAEPK